MGPTYGTFSTGNDVHFMLFCGQLQTDEKMYADWSSLTLQLQSLGTATQSVLAKLPPEDAKQVRLWTVEVDSLSDLPKCSFHWTAE